MELEIEEAKQTYQANRTNTNDNKNFEPDTTPINWQHPADVAIRTHTKKKKKITRYRSSQTEASQKREWALAIQYLVRARTLRLHSVD